MATKAKSAMSKGTSGTKGHAGSRTNNASKKGSVRGSTRSSSRAVAGRRAPGPSGAAAGRY